MSSKRIIWSILGCIMILDASGQPLGNEWINYDQTYYRIPAGQEGIYRITYDQLLDAGVPVNTIDPAGFQIFHRGMEMAIHVEGQGDSRFDPGDYLDFYGQRNDGTLDAHLYVTEEAQPHTFYNLYSDTTFYFLTWRLDGLPGKRIQNFTGSNTNGLPAEPYHWEKKLRILTDTYSPGLLYPLGSSSAETRNAHFDYGEGWTGTVVRKGQSVDYILDSIDYRYTSDPRPILRILLAGRYNGRHNTRIEAGPDNVSLRSLGNIEYEYHNNALFADTLEWTDIGTDGSITIRITAEGYPESAFDNLSVSYILLEFPREMDQDGKAAMKYTLEDNPGSISYVEITNVVNPGWLWDLTDPYNIRNIGYDLQANTLSAMVPDTDFSRTLLYTSEILSPAGIRKISFRRINPGTANYFIIYHDDFTGAAGNYSNPVRSYASYRASPEGGGFDTLSFEIHDLFNQYSYGEYTPLAIRNFCRHMAGIMDPGYLFLIGKGLTVNYGYFRGKQTANAVKDWVPTAGYPASDILFTAGLNGATDGPGIPTGRLTAQDAADVAHYLDKVKETESFTFDDLWKKEIIQLSGGISASELVRFRQYIDEFKAVEEDLYLGASTKNIYKESNNSVELINISEEINKGKSLVLFFGHSAPTITDIDIGFASDPSMGYNNKERYPFMFVNGCDAGNIFTPFTSFGEDWLITAQKGAIGFNAHSDVGYSTQLKAYTDLFLATAYSDSSNIYQSVGTILQKTASGFLERYALTERNIAQVQQNVLQGDPAVRLFGADKPDYSLSDNMISVVNPDQGPITTLTDSIDLAFVVRNFGRADESPFYVAIERTLPDGTILQPDPRQYSPVYYQDTLFFRLNNNIEGAFGLNRFRITVDPLDSIPELRETNNVASFDFFLPRLGTQNLFPYNYGIVQSSPEQLVAQATDLLGNVRQFQMEMDTMPDYNSPVRQSYSASGKGIAIWEAELFRNFPMQDSTVFFWRSRFSDILPGEEDNWSEYSFLYIGNGPEGFAQKSVHQFLENESEGIFYNPSSGGWEFETYETSVEVTTYGSNHPDKTYTDVSLILNGIPFIYNTRYCTANSINAIAFDEVTTNPYLVMKFGDYDILDRRSCGRQPQTINNFINNEISGPDDYLSNYIDALNAGDHVLIFSIGNVTYSTWAQALKDKLQEIGVPTEVIENLNDGDPLILVGRKGAPAGSATIIIADGTTGTPGDEQEIRYTGTLNGFATTGTILSPRIGPSDSWYDFYNQVRGTESPVTDQYSFQLIGINQENTESVLQYGITANQVDISGVNPDLFPYLRLKFTTTDTTEFTPAQLKHWIVTYEPMPEGILYPDPEQELSGIEADEGETIDARFIFRNISDKNFSDSLKVLYSLFNRDGRFRKSDSLNLKPLLADEEEKFTLALNTRSAGGINDLDVAVNPYILPERYYNNNYLNLPGFLIVNRDNINPVLDVAFDGRYILDGDIVSPSPLISIIVRDENEILRKTDTTGVEILLKPPCEACFFGRISFSDPDVTWYPATDKMDFRVEYKPPPLADGMYTLRVQASDASGNLSGSEPYQIRFEVINESQITNFYPYPNPFSSSTRFVFTMTGSVIPDRFKIQIMTISGKVIREITRDEIGPIHIGNNITDYAWDGRDEYGDQLANGVYLYRVVMDTPGQEFKHRSTMGDRGFTKGYGKLYLLR